jgi:hypothetical protein
MWPNLAYFCILLSIKFTIHESKKIKFTIHQFFPQYKKNIFLKRTENTFKTLKQLDNFKT